MQTHPKKSTIALYERDYLLWLDTTVHLLKQREFVRVDIENLIEELEDMGKSQKNALESNLRVVLMHLLKYQYQPEKRSNSWRATLREHRIRLRKAFKDSPSLKRYFEDIFAECYEDARAIAADETDLSLSEFPEISPFSQEDSLNEEYLPD
ncbi:MAG: DUF29 domain-containing protein [Spirulina sp.]